MSVSTSLVPVEIGSFFQQLYGKEPFATEAKKSQVYGVPGEGISIVADPYGGCHIEVNGIAAERIAAARRAIEHLAETYRLSGAFDSLWIDVALPATMQVVGALTPESFEVGRPGKGDLVYDYQQKKIKIWQWLNHEKECQIPPGATHNIGATAMLVDRAAAKVLLVVNTRRDTAWNLPGGSYDPLLDNAPCYTALREAQEEGGFSIDDSLPLEPKLIAQMQFPYNQFAPAINQVWAYFIDGISKNELHPPAGEIKRAEWVDLAKIFESEGTLEGLTLGEEIKTPLIAALNDLGCEKIMDKGWMVVHSLKA